MTNHGEQLFHVQDADRPMWVVAPNYVEALRRWEMQMRAENEIPDGEPVPPPDGIAMVCDADDLLPAPPQPAVSDLRAEQERLIGVLQRIDGGDNPCTDEAKLRQWAYEAVTLGRSEAELSA